MKFKPEIRVNEDGSLDEVVAHGNFHLEQMSDSGWWMAIYPDSWAHGYGIHINLFTLKGAHILGRAEPDEPCSIADSNGKEYSDVFVPGVDKR